MKMASMILLLFLISHVIFAFVTATGTMDDLMRLDGQLFQNYSNDLRPVYNLSDTLNVETSLYLLALLNFDEVSGIIHLSTVLGISWTDYRLAWNTSEYGGVTNFIVNSSRIWKPRIFLISSADDLIEFTDNHFDVRVFSNGTAVFNPGKLIKSSCNVDMTFFPTDTHVCSISIVPWMHTIEEVKLLFDESKIRMDFFKSHGAWEIYDTSIIYDVKLTAAVSIVEFILYLRRKPQYFILSLGVPILLLCFLNPFVFLLPAASGERISFAVTMFLSMAVYMSSIGEVMPKVSDPIAGASYFLLGAMCFSCLLILLTILSLCCDVVSDVTIFPRWLLSMVRCHSSRNRHSRKGSGSAKQVTGVVGKDNNDMSDKKESDVEMKQTVNDGILKSDVTKFIDKSLFWITEAFIVASVCAFLLLNIKFT